MFQYDAVADTWTQIGRMESLRFAHGVVAANLSAIGCTAYNAKGESRSLLDEGVAIKMDLRQRVRKSISR